MSMSMLLFVCAGGGVVVSWSYGEGMVWVCRAVYMNWGVRIEPFEFTNSCGEERDYWTRWSIFSFPMPYRNARLVGISMSRSGFDLG